MKTLKELADIGAVAAFASDRLCCHYMGVSEKSHSWIPDEPARQAFAQAVRDAVLADLETKSDSSPTFEAHGFTWTRHKPGDPMPCDGEAVINWLTSLEIEGAQYVHSTMKASNLLWSAPVGWRYAEPTPPITKTVPLTHQMGANELTFRTRHRRPSGWRAVGLFAVGWPVAVRNQERQTICIKPTTTKR